jgi:glycosyltransferase involved in cell wall biosynthesis
MRNIVFDVRCLQDARYRDRGVGRLAANLVRSARKFAGSRQDVRIIGIADDALPPLEQRFSIHLDETHMNSYPAGENPCWFIQLSPMTHDPLHVARILDSPHAFKTAIVYDFIPLRARERYLPTLAHKIDYHTKLSWLSRYDHFFPISNHTRSELRQLLGIPERRMTVCAPPIDAAFLRPEAPSPATAPGHILVAGGGDTRKNVECPVRAHAVSLAVRTRRVPLLVAGSYPLWWQDALHQLHGGMGGTRSLLFFLEHVADDEFVKLYRSALCVIVPSRDEGFSIPVVEAMAAGVPVFASSIPAHCELVENHEFMFGPEDDKHLTRLLDRVITSSRFRNNIINDQSHRWQRFRDDEVARLFWVNMEKHAPAVPAAPVIGGRRPRIAFLTPLPPDRSGVADYTAATFKELGKHADVHVFTATKTNKAPAGVAAVAPISAWPYITAQFDRIVGVMGNSHFHLEVFDLLMRYGGACIEHDNRLIGFYRMLLGEARARVVAERELKRPLETGELEGWLVDESTLDATFLGEVAERSEPLFVHSRGTADLVRARFGIEARHLPFSIYRDWHEDQLRPGSRAAARKRLGISSDEVSIITMGYVAPVKAPAQCIWALEMLHGWGIPAKLYFVGETAMELPTLEGLCAELDLTSHVCFVSDYVSEQDYRDYLLAADVAVQLRTHLLGGLSGALLDCIAIGLPTVANHDLARSMEAPSYVSVVPDRPSPVLIAEALADALERRAQNSHADERRAYCETHSFRVYAERLCGALSLEVVRPAAR